MMDIGKYFREKQDIKSKNSNDDNIPNKLTEESPELASSNYHSLTMLFQAV